jgi:hypothetical protein
MGGKQTKAREDRYYITVAIKAYQKARLVTMPSGGQRLVSNWNNPEVFQFDYAPYSNPSSALRGIFEEIKSKNMMIYNIDVDTEGRMPRVEIMQQLESIVEEFKELFPSMADDTQPATMLSIVYNGIVSLPLLRLRTKGIKIYATHGTRPDRMEPLKQDVNFVEPVFMDDGMSLPMSM